MPAASRMIGAIGPAEAPRDPSNQPCNPSGVNALIQVVEAGQIVSGLAERLGQHFGPAYLLTRQNAPPSRSSTVVARSRLAQFATVLA